MTHPVSSHRQIESPPHRDPVSRPVIAGEKLLTADEVAARLDVGVKWVWAQARAGSIPHVKLGRYRRFRQEAIDRWIADLESGSTT